MRIICCARFSREFDTSLLFVVEIEKSVSLDVMLQEIQESNFCKRKIDGVLDRASHLTSTEDIVGNLAIL